MRNCNRRTENAAQASNEESTLDTTCMRRCALESVANSGAAENSRETSAVRRFAAATELGAELAATEGAAVRPRGQTTDQ